MGYPYNPTAEVMDDMYAMAYAARRPNIVDNIFGQTAGWNLLVKQKKASRPQRGGRFIEQPLRYAKNETIRFIGRGANMTVTDTQSLTMAYFNWKYAAGSVARYFTDDQQLTGKTQIKSQVKEKLDVLEMSMVEYMEAALFGDGTGDGGLAITGLQNVIDTTPATGTIGGLNAATYSWWRNQSTAYTGSFDVYGVSDWRTMRNDCSNGGQDYPDIMITDQDQFEAYEDEGLEYYQTSDRSLVDLSFENLKFKGSTLVWATSMLSAATYFINSKYINVVYDPLYVFTMTPWKDIPTQVNDRVAQIVWAGNITCSNRSRHGVQTGYTA